MMQPALPARGFTFDGSFKEFDMSEKKRTDDKAPAFDDNEKVGPDKSKVQVRDAGKEAQADKPKKWDERDEASDESFPASDSSAKY